MITPTFQHVIDSAILQETTPVPAAAVKSKATTESTAMKIANLLYTVQCAECRLLVALSSSKTIDSIHTPHVACISVENTLCIYTRHISVISTGTTKSFFLPIFSPTLRRSQRLTTWICTQSASCNKDVSKNRGKTPKMDGL